MGELGEWAQARVYDVMDGLLVLFVLGATAFLGALAAGAVVLPLGLAWEFLNPDVSGSGDHPRTIYWIGLGVFALTWCAAAGHAFKRNGMNGFSRD